MKQPIEKLSPFKIAAIYAIAGGLWILFSDLILASIVKNSYLLTRVQTYKGWFFVCITSALLFLLVSRYVEGKRVTEERQRIFSEMTSDYVYVVRIEPDGRPVLEWISESYERITGYTFEDMRARSNLFEDIYPDDMAAVLEENRRVMTGESTVFDTRIITRKGDVLWLRNYVRPIWDAHHNRIVAIYGAAQDITGRKKAEELLRETIERLNFIVEHTGTGLWDWNLDTNRVHYSREWKGLLGYEEYEVADHLDEWRRLTHQDDIEPTLVKVNAFLQHPVGTLEAEFRMRHKSGEYRWILSRATTRLGDDGKPIHLLGLHIDITERKQAEAALRESRDRLKKVLEVETVGVMFWDLASGCMTDANDSFLNMMGYSRREVEARELTWQKLTPPEYLEVSLAEIRKFQATGRVGPYEKEYFRKDGTRQWFVFAGSSLGPNTCVEFCVDITERKKAEEALREKEHLLSESQRIAHVGSWSWNLTGPVQWTDELYRVYGVSPEMFTPTIESFFDLVYHEDRPLMKEWLRACGAGESPADFEFRAVRPDGSVRVISGSGELIYDAENKPVYMAGTAQDITGRKKAEEELAQYARDLSSLTRASNEMSFLPLHKNIYDTFCKTMVGDFGLDMVWLEMVKEETCEKAPIAGESSEQFLLEQIKFVWGFLREEPTSIAAQKLPGEIAADLRYPGEIAMLIDQDTCRIINDLSGHNLFPQWRDAALKLGYNSAAGLPLISSEGDFIGILHLFSRTPQFFTDDRLKIFDSFIKIAVKVIENRRLIEGLEHSVNMRTKEILTANEKLRELDRLKSMFIASMSHELRTPLNSIIGFSGILLDEWTGRLNDEQKQNLAIVLRSGKHLLAVINDVIDVSKIEAGTIDINVKDFDLYDVVKETSASFDNEIKDKGLTLEVESIHQMMHTDRRRLIQCLSNLVSNAVKFTEKGSVRLSARLIASSKVQVAREDLETRSNIKGQESSKAKDESALLRDPMALDPDNDFIEISVTDTGIGIKDEDMAQLFQPFTRLESPLKAAVPGTGLGLYLTRKLVTEALKGDIMGESEYGRGSKFTIRVPVSVV